MKTTPIHKILFLILMTLLCSCDNDDPTATNGPDPIPGFLLEFVPDSPQLVSFTNTSEHADKFEWDFGDDSELSYEKHPSHKYKNPGTYTVGLKAMLGNLLNSTSQEIVVFGNPYAEFAYEAKPNDGLTLDFENLSQNLDAFTWDFGDGTGTSTDRNPSYTYAEEGAYTVVLTGTGEGGEADFSKEIQIADRLPFENLYLIGDATPSGWNLATPEVFTQSDSDLNIFTFEGELVPGELKITTFTSSEGDFCGGKWLNATMADQVLSATDYLITNGCDGPDNKWRVTDGNQGIYRITVNFGNGSLVFEKQFPPYFNLYIVGDASPNGWNVTDPEGFIQNDSDAFIFTFEGILTPGEFKIATFVSPGGDFCGGDWLNATMADQVLSATDYLVTKGCEGPDNKWRVTDGNQGIYKITVNFGNGSLVFEEQFPPYSNLYIVGDASPNGWNVTDPEAFTQSDSNPFIFTFEGILTPGEFKIAAFMSPGGDFCGGDWLNATMADQVLSATDYLVTNGCDGPDNKWRVIDGTQGNYKITINLYDHTIVFESI